MILHPSRRRIAGITLGVVTIAAAAGATAANPAGATTVVAQVAALVSCASTSPCASWTNSSSGPGLTGSNTKNGYGVGGYAASNDGVYGYSATGDGVVGKTGGNTAPGVAGYSGTNVGVYGSAHSSGTGIKGYSEHGVGIYGVTLGDGYGVYGSVADGVALYGVASTGYGAYTSTSSGYGLFANASTGTGVSAYSASGRAIDASSSGGLAVHATNSSGNGGDFSGSYIGLLGRAPASGGFPLTLTDSNGNNLFYVDGAGNVSYHGGLFNFARGTGGVTVRALTPASTKATVEDTGGAQLVGGAATVRLDPSFASSIEPLASYRIFITPYGDTHGLYVALKTPAGFVVREAQNGHSTIAFDYRIVGIAAGRTADHLAVMNAAAGPAMEPHAPVPTNHAIKQIAPPKEPVIANP